jgi:ABC-type branched-subunit amino acid transport system substrate-binding protein
MKVSVALLPLLCSSILVKKTASQDGLCNQTDIVFDSERNACVCIPQTEDDLIYIAGIFDTSDFYWGEELFEYTIEGIRNGWFNDFWALLQEPNLRYAVADAACKETTAARSYWELRQQNNGRPPHGIVGARCSGASISLARIAGLEGVPQVSPDATSSKLSDNDEFPYFFRLLAPDDARGEVGALMAMMRGLKWDRVTILTTDTQYAKDLTTEFRKLWEGPHNKTINKSTGKVISGKWTGDVPYSNTIRLNLDDSVDQDSVRQVLREVPTDDPKTNSRVILLVAHTEHAYPILEIANQINFQPDTIWVGPSSWVGQKPIGKKEFGEWLPRYPGYLGSGPFRNEDEIHQQFLSGLREWQASQDKPVWEELPIFAAQLVDSIVALVGAFREVESNNRRNGTAIAERLRNLDFEGVSGRVHFTPEGDLKDPQFSISHLRTTYSGELRWETVGAAGNEIGSADISLEDICFAELECNLEEAPSDSYPVPVPRDKLPGWTVAIIVIFGLLFLAVSVKYWRSRKSKQRIKSELDAFRDSVVGMRTAEKYYLPTVVVGDNGNDVENPKATATKEQPMTNAQWCWKETPHVMDRHNAEVIAGDPADCWIKYDEDSNAKLEVAFQKDGGNGDFSPIPGYVVSFTTMTQTKSATGFQREVRRLVEDAGQQDNGAKQLGLEDAQVGGILPSDIRKEPQMVLVKGDVVQISKQRPDGWAFGTKVRILSLSPLPHVLSFPTY